MKQLRQFCAAVMLGCIFFVSVSAGDMHAGITNPPPPPPQRSTATEDVTNEMSDEVVQIVVTLLQNVLSVL